MPQECSEINFSMAISGIDLVLDLFNELIKLLLLLFFKFHVELILKNSSTLDNLVREKDPNPPPNVYDVGAY